MCVRLAPKNAFLRLKRKEKKKNNNIYNNIQTSMNFSGSPLKNAFHSFHRTICKLLNGRRVTSLQFLMKMSFIFVALHTCFVTAVAVPGPFTCHLDTWEREVAVFIYLFIYLIILFARFTMKRPNVVIDTLC